MKIFLSPHSDDETLFGAFSIMREKPLVIVVYDGHIQRTRGATNFAAIERRTESVRAMMILGAPIKFLGLCDDRDYTPQDVVFRMRSAVEIDEPFDALYAPMHDVDGHDQHNVVSLASGLLASRSYVKYSTYTRSGGRQRTGREVLPSDGDMIRRKHMALACYASQMDMNPKLGTWPWFVDSMREYVA